jgi:uncharacterized protein YjbI with pentapeptide repeats
VADNNQRKGKGRHPAIVRPHLPPAAASMNPFDDQLMDHGVYADLILSSVSLAGQTAQRPTFESVVVSNGRLNATVLPGVHWRDARFDTCDLAEADWEHADLARVELLSCRLLGFKATEALIQDAIFKDCDARFAVWFSTRFKAVRFERCMLDETSFQEADLTGVIFRQCDLRQADLRGAKLIGADFRGSQVEGMRVGPADVRGAIIEPAQAIAFAGLLGLDVRYAE